ncbi:flagellar biosynthetic protein FliO [Hyphomonadaceae bacterium ML37]|nr:flagellar biosynthetic protein FliO [Hyphomonadaceae bacterium ML37]
MDQVDFIRFFAALILVLGLLGGFWVILRKGWLPSGFSGLVNLQPARGARRLSIRESLLLDPRRRVVIVRADGIEHVVLLGASGETVLDTRPAPPEPVFEPVFESAPDVDSEPDPDMDSDADSAARRAGDSQP